LKTLYYRDEHISYFIVSDTRIWLAPGGQKPQAETEAATRSQGEFGMARYFFQAQYRGAVLTDEIGEEFSTLHDAEAHAAVVARELGRNSPEAIVSVLGEDGKLLAYKTTNGANFRGTLELRL
jgi:hypothetical protein